MLSNQRIIHRESGDMEFFYQSSARYLSSKHSDFHILQAMQRRKLVKMVNLGKEIENDKK